MTVSAARIGDKRAMLHGELLPGRLQEAKALDSELLSSVRDRDLICSGLQHCLCSLGGERERE